MRTPGRLLTLLGLLLAVGLPLAARWARQQTGPSCALDGAPVAALYRVRVVDERGVSREFCCIRCAELWLRHGREGEVYLTDEASGQELPRTAAYFVRSLVVTQPTTGNRIHVFRRRSDAEEHARLHGGTVLRDDERPFQGLTGRPEL